MSRNEGRFGAADETPTPEDEGTPAAAVSAQNTGFSWAAPTEFVELPSRGRFYPPDHPLHGEETIEIKYMTAKEEDILTDRALLKKGVAIDRALQNLITDKRIKVDDLFVGDKNALVIAARITGYGEDYTTKVTCPSCSEVAEFSFDLSSVKTLDIDEALSEAEAELTERNTFRVSLPFSKAVVECRMLTGRDETEMAKISLRNERKKQGSTMLTDQLKKMIVSINGEADKVKILMFVETMPARDSRHLRNVLADVVPNIDLKQFFECTGCGHSADLEVPLTSDFFWPK